MADPIWNVRTCVVELVPAATAGEAIEKLHKKLSANGFEPYPFPFDCPDAFESEQLDSDVESDIYRKWMP